MIPFEPKIGRRSRGPIPRARISSRLSLIHICIEIARWVAAGRTDREILETYVEQYLSLIHI